MASSRRLFTSLVWLLVAVLPGCAGREEWLYEKSRVTPAQFDQDKAACRRAAPSHNMFKTFDDDKVDRPAFNRCMERRGYTVTVVPLP